MSVVMFPHAQIAGHLAGPVRYSVVPMLFMSQVCPPLYVDIWFLAHTHCPPHLYQRVLGLCLLMVSTAAGCFDSLDSYLNLLLCDCSGISIPSLTMAIGGHFKAP